VRRGVELVDGTVTWCPLNVTTNVSGGWLVLLLVLITCTCGVVTVGFGVDVYLITVDFSV